jgi:ferredoxin
MFEISINQKECLGCSFCNGCLPELFEVDEKDFRCKIKKDGQLVNQAAMDLSPEQLKQVEEVSQGCPVQVIKVTKI